MYDDEKLSKELTDLKRYLKDVYNQNMDLQSLIKQTETKRRDKEIELDQTISQKKMVLNPTTGKLESIANLEASKAKMSFGFKMDDIPEYDKVNKE